MWPVRRSSKFPCLKCFRFLARIVEWPMDKERWQIEIFIPQKFQVYAYRIEIVQGFGYASYKNNKSEWNGDWRLRSVIGIRYTDKSYRFIIAEARNRQWVRTITSWSWSGERCMGMTGDVGGTHTYTTALTVRLTDGQATYVHIGLTVCQRRYF